MSSWCKEAPLKLLMYPNSRGFVYECAHNTNVDIFRDQKLPHVPKFSLILAAQGLTLNRFSGKVLTIDNSTISRSKFPASKFHDAILCLMRSNIAMDLNFFFQYPMANELQKINAWDPSLGAQDGNFCVFVNVLLYLDFTLSLKFVLWNSTLLGIGGERGFPPCHKCPTGL